MNLLIISGNLTDEPQCGVTANGVPYAHFSVAVTDFGGVTSFFRITAWRNQATACGNSLHKGNKVLVKGSVAIKQYDNSNGGKGINVEVTAQEVEFLSPKGAGKPKQDSDLSTLNPVDEDLPF